ncbi:hypothetical protein AMECASPLE_017447 [Ameca splendens]|uniref:Uncharacterized protein n=1 Tax=Ameca splendens TaxID=208324 RepID=A0ABV0XRR6_9TELE
MAGSRCTDDVQWRHLLCLFPLCHVHTALQEDGETETLHHNPQQPAACNHDNLFTTTSSSSHLHPTLLFYIPQMFGDLACPLLVSLHFPIYHSNNLVKNNSYLSGLEFKWVTFFGLYYLWLHADSEKDFKLFRCVSLKDHL